MKGEPALERPASVLFFDNLNVACFAQDGQQIPVMQKSLASLYAEFAELVGYDLDGIIVETQAGHKWRFIKDKVDGIWNRELVS